MRIAAVAGAALLLSAPAGLRAQKGADMRCTYEGEHQENHKTASGQYDVYIGGNAIARCPAKKIIIKADSIEQHVDEKRVYLLGHVYYEEPTYNVHSDYLTYYQTDDRVVAVGNVDARMANGSTLQGPNAIYLRKTTARPRSHLTATQRPTVSIVDKDSTGKPVPPVKVTANTLVMDGDSLVFGSGLVQMVRDDFTGTCDSVFMDGTKETVHMMRNPVITGQKGRPFTLTGIAIDLFSRQRKLRRVVSKGKGNAVSQDLTLTADTINLVVNDDVLERSEAWGPKRATAKSPTQSLLADSIDVIMPQQRVREIRAVRKARAEAKPDTVKFRTNELDWLTARTIVAYFDTMPPKDTSQAPRIRRLIGRDSAASYYNFAPSDSSCHIPAINYATGDTITVNFGDHGVDSVKVIGQRDGVMLQPCAASDSSKSKPKKPPVPAPSMPYERPRE